MTITTSALRRALEESRNELMRMRSFGRDRPGSASAIRALRAIITSSTALTVVAERLSDRPGVGPAQGTQGPRKTDRP